MIYLTFNPEKFLPDAKHVLVFASPDTTAARSPGTPSQLVLTRHRRRGWEVPGGKVEPGETPEAAARREMYEETGIKLKNLKWIGQYTISPGKHAADVIVKNIYRGNIDEWSSLPEGFETIESRLFPFTLQPFKKGYSDFIQDNLFPLVRNYFQQKAP
nr:NUDIX domain-containing protein [Aneurinibacillus terranovensis]